MKLQGRVIEGPAEEVVVFPRTSGELVFKAKAVLAYDDFLKLCPMPTPPEVIRKGGEKSLDTEDEKYKTAVDVWATKKTDWMVLQSLSATESLEFETVKMSDTDTYSNYHQELVDAGFSEGEINRIIGIVVSVNGLDQSKIDEATERFLAAQEAPPSE